ncbi:MAG: 4Fe-4S dicluster domain-containing protein [bacterium]|nr:4Fe-4S dicluster domain-containing protein [bacterium]
MYQSGNTVTSAVGEKYIVDRVQLPQLFTALHQRGYELIGPSRNQNAIVYTSIESIDDLPTGWTDAQEAGAYRLTKQDAPMLFNYVVSQDSWKKFLSPSVRQLWKAERSGKSYEIRNPKSKIQNPKYAFIGVRACELNAILIQDKIFTTPPFVDTYYTEQRKTAFIIAVNCSVARDTCFCVSMQTGPKVTQQLGFDLALTEPLPEAKQGQHRFLIEVGSQKGAEVLTAISTQSATNSDLVSAEKVVAGTIAQITRSLDTTELKNLLYRNLEHPHWQEIATRCLTCGNCTMVCPTCFCFTVEDTTDLTGNYAERSRKTDSCFTLDFSYIHGGSVRPSPYARYRQWLTHKLASWLDEFGTSGCVGCGRCITWCPVGIEITEEVRFFREAESKLKKE